MKTKKPSSKKEVKRAVKRAVGKKTKTDAVDSVDTVQVKSVQKWPRRKGKNAGKKK
jgi:hypothetical protein